MKLKPRSTPTTYVPKRAHRGHGVTSSQERELRRMARLIPNQAALNSVVMQSGAGRPDHERQEIWRRGYSRVAEYVPFQAKSFDESGIAPLKTEPIGVE